MTLMLAIAGLILPAVLGAGAGAAGLFEAPDRAVDHLNRFALYVAFPALVYAGLAGSEVPLPTAPGFWLVVPLAVALALAPLRALARGVGTGAGTLALVTVFGNVAYLGLPVVERVLGPEALPSAGLLVGQYVLLSMTLGPFLLLYWSDQGGRAALAASLRAVARQPLVWAPVLGVASGLLPDAIRQGSVALVAPLGKAAAPVALFLLGLYLHTHRARLRQVGRADVAHVAVKLAWVPAAAAIVGAAARRWGGLAEADLRIVLVLAAMPPAITTFAIARELRTGSDLVARAIVAGTLCSAVTVPLVVWALG